MSDAIFRLRVAHAKQGRLRHLGHLEVLRTIERCVRRAGLPFAVTQGFSPHMRVQFCSALPTGVASTCECYDAFLTSLVAPEEALEALVRSTPVDLMPFAACYVTREVPALEFWLTRSRWELTVDGPSISGRELASALDAIIATGELTYMRGDKPKHVDLTQTLVSHDVREAGEGSLLVTLEARSGPTGALRPAALVNAALAALDVTGVVPGVTRVGQWHEEEDGTLASPLPERLPWPSPTA